MKLLEKYRDENVSLYEDSKRRRDISNAWSRFSLTGKCGSIIMCSICPFSNSNSNSPKCRDKEYAINTLNEEV